jgi:D-alanyl-D-alanine carboxypeptidase/D-alanyl-D-alanine-endopeptidase (penicillin-binding protein 4)
MAVCALATGLGAAAQGLPPEVDAALQRAGVSRESVAALDLLGPAYTWSTPVYVDGTVQGGMLNGNLVIKGLGDPKLVSERLWLLMRRVQGLGIRNIGGDIVLDHSAFEAVETDPASFDGEPLRPYNAAPDALLVNFKSVVMTFVPDRANNVAQVQVEPALAGVQMQAMVPLSSAPCSDYRSGLKADFSDPAQLRFLGAYPASCGERIWPVAYADPKSYAARAVEAAWRDLGGKLGGKVRDGKLPAALASAAKPAFELASPQLAEVIRDINKYSNNVMAQQLFLTLSLPPRQDNVTASPNSNAVPAGSATLAASREIVQRWWRNTLGDADAPVLDNGSGLSRSERISAQALGKLLQTAYASPFMPELMSSLPITGMDGTQRSNRSKARGTAHLKTGTLNNVAAIAGYVLAQSGRRYAVVMLVNQAGAGAAKPAMDALLDWVVRDR